MTPLTLTFVEQCYQQVCFGREEPTHIAMSYTRKVELIKLLMTTRHFPEYVSRFDKIVFNNAELVARESFSNDLMTFVNVFIPNNPKYNQVFEIK